MNNSLTARRMLKRSFWLWFGGIWLVVGLPLFGAGTYFALEELRYRTSGETAEGVVLSAGIEDSEDNSYRVRYRFRTREGRDLEGSGTLPQKQGEALRPGAGIRVEYLPASPERNRPAGSGEGWLAFFVVPFSGLFVGIGGYLFFRDVARIRAALRLAREGALVDATVLAVEESNLSVNDVPQWVVRYAFVDFRGQRREAKSDYLPPEEAAEWKPGDSAAVRYDQSHPERSVFLGRGS